MDISKKTDYALRMIASLVRDPGAVVSVRTAAEDNGIPYSFARSIQHDLVEAGIIRSLRGAHGGMRLAVDPQATTLLQVVEAIQGPVRISSCEEGDDCDPCPNRPTCTLGTIWDNARNLLADYLSSVTLAEAVSGGGEALASSASLAAGR